MKKTTVHIIIILSILFVSCKKETKTDEKTVVGKTELKPEKVDNSNDISPKIEQKKKLKKQVSIDTLIIQKDTLFIEKKHFLKQTENYAKCSGQLNGIDIYFIGKTKPNSDYKYCIGRNPKNKENESKPTIVLLKSDKIVDQLELNGFIHSGYIIYLNNPTIIKLKDVDEIINLSYGQGFGGGNYGECFFFRKKDKLIKGLSIGGYGEPGAEYFEQNVIASDEQELNQIWVENKVGKEDIIYFAYIEKYEFRNDSLIRLNPKKDTFFYVTAKSGLTQRSEPSIDGESLGKLTYKTKVKVLNKTEIEMTINDNGKQINGHWVQIEYNGEQPYDHSFFVFDGYLSKDEPNE